MYADRIALTMTPFEWMLEELQAAINSGDEAKASELRAKIEAYLERRGA